MHEASCTGRKVTITGRSIHTYTQAAREPGSYTSVSPAARSLLRYGYSVYSIRYVARIMPLHARYIRCGLFDGLASRKVRHSERARARARCNIVRNGDKVCRGKVQSSVKRAFCTVRGTSGHSFQDCDDRAKNRSCFGKGDASFGETMRSRMQTRGRVSGQPSDLFPRTVEDPAPTKRRFIARRGKLRDFPSARVRNFVIHSHATLARLTSDDLTSASSSRHFVSGETEVIGEKVI